MTAREVASSNGGDVPDDAARDPSLPAPSKLPITPDASKDAVPVAMKPPASPHDAMPWIPGGAVPLAPASDDLDEVRE